ncbi:hypothetical protein EES45_20230 [Streptomyces sp. ADI97-07]|uniref:Uncharacterized protein n=1 Tax=Streptomyces clavifer TaxID=68188 RepID=A0ABS4VA72_9ACTN|nr:hypothetical protein ASD26_25320 [Streptomyces sp. Root1319]KQZ03458.1 hypothetical protein ASD51_20400 [Streptomyces sp. Root55]MBP2360815.1 hypothetical protein [Streptomyces clavifer]RPK77702.1 hypothetical protein EES45_20230 [Streptomyces sp. ADI97-07]GHB12265.1 hypothetical protein GCM10010392_45000 [Streptomyces clavifer]
MDQRGPGEAYEVRARPQAADVPPDEELAGEGDAEDDVEAVGFESDPDVDGVVEAEPDAFADDVAGVLLDEEPRLSFR